MVRLTAVYPNSEGARFDFDYYVNQHLPMSRERLREFGMGRITLERGAEGMEGGAAPYVCILHVEFADLERLKEGLERHGEELMADIPNYTDIEPRVQFSRIVETGDRTAATDSGDQ